MRLAVLPHSCPTVNQLETGVATPGADWQTLPNWAEQPQSLFEKKPKMINHTAAFHLYLIVLPVIVKVSVEKKQNSIIRGWMGECGVVIAIVWMRSMHKYNVFWNSNTVDTSIHTREICMHRWKLQYEYRERVWRKYSFLWTLFFFTISVAHGWIILEPWQLYSELWNWWKAWGWTGLSAVAVCVRPWKLVSSCF